jgi:hypothetical protein
MILIFPVNLHTKQTTILKRIKATKEGEGWRTWSQDLILDCFKKPSGKTYSSVYGRMKWNGMSLPLQ